MLSVAAAEPNGKTNAVQQLLSIFCRSRASAGHTRQMPELFRFVAFFPPNQLSRNCRRFLWVGGDLIVRIGVGFVVVTLIVGGSIGGSVGAAIAQTYYPPPPDYYPPPRGYYRHLPVIIHRRRMITIIRFQPIAARRCRPAMSARRCLLTRRAMRSLLRHPTRRPRAAVITDIPIRPPSNRLLPTFRGRQAKLAARPTSPARSIRLRPPLRRRTARPSSPDCHRKTSPKPVRPNCRSNCTGNSSITPPRSRPARS